MFNEFVVLLNWLSSFVINVLMSTPLGLFFIVLVVILALEIFFYFLLRRR